MAETSTILQIAGSFIIPRSHMNVLMASQPIYQMVILHKLQVCCSLSI